MTGDHLFVHLAKLQLQCASICNGIACNGQHSQTEEKKTRRKTMQTKRLRHADPTQAPVNIIEYLNGMAPIY